MERLTQITKQMAVLASERDAIEKREFDQQVAAIAEASIGKCFVYRRNCYSCPSKPSDYWDTFVQVLRVVRKPGWAEVVVRTCYVDSYGRAFANTEGKPIYANTLPRIMQDCYTPCTRKEFSANWKRVMRLLETGSSIKLN